MLMSGGAEGGGGSLSMIFCAEPLCTRKWRQPVDTGLEQKRGSFVAEDGQGGVRATAHLHAKVEALVLVGVVAGGHFD